MNALRTRTATRALGFPTRSRAGQRVPRRYTSSSASSSTGGVGYALAAGLALVSGGLGYYAASGPSASAFGSASAGSTAKPTYGTKEDYQRAIEELRSTFSHEPEAVSTEEGVLQTHGFSIQDPHPGHLHSVVVFVKSTEDVVKVVKIANKYKMPIIPYSGGTSLEGQTRGHEGSGGISLNMSQMDKIIAIHEADSDVVLQPGVGYVDLNEELQQRGINLFLPLDPGPGATVGGMFNTGCSGTNAVRYGTAKGEWFLNATIVLPSGEVIKTRQRARKSSAGFDTTKLFIGSEGTLGIVTELTVRLAPVLPTRVAVVAFPDVRAAVAASTEIVNAVGAGVQCVELCDDRFMAATNIYGAAKRKYAEKDSLYIKFQGASERAIKEAADIAGKIAKSHGGVNFEMTKTKAEADELWQDRKNALWSGMALLPDSKAWSTDVCVPVSRLPDLVLETKADIEASGIVSTIVGHVGDGNFHSLLLFRNDEERAVCKGLVKRMVERAIAMDGTCTGEHGVGMGKREYLTKELGHGTVAFMKKLKDTIDPNGIMNPGKLYPEEDGSEPLKVADQAYASPTGQKEK